MSYLSSQTIQEFLANEIDLDRNQETDIKLKLGLVEIFFQALFLFLLV